MEDFEVLGTIAEIETIAAGHSIRDLGLLRELYGRGNWRKMKGTATVRLPDGAIEDA